MSELLQTPAVGEVSIDALLPADMAAKAETVGVKKAALPWANMMALAVLAGAFIAVGAFFASTVATGFAAAGWPVGLQRLLAGIVFSVGLILVVVGGAELFTGNNLIIMAWAGGRVSGGRLLRNWFIVYVGNFAGALATVALMFIGKQYLQASGSMGLQALNIAEAKTSLGFAQAVSLGILCNALVCLAVWLTYSARSTTDKILAIVPPVAAFVAAGFEHSIANMYFIPMGMVIKQYAPASYWESIGKTAADFPHITMQNFLVDNLLPVTIGNIIGGTLLVGGFYWFIYLRVRADKRA
jgi:formate transporter FocA